MHAIDLDSADTWPPALSALVRDTARARKGTVSSASDLHLSDGPEFRAALGGAPVRAYHCTRLLDQELEQIKTQGLRRLSPALLSARIDMAQRVGAIDADEAQQLHRSHWLNNPRQRAIREGLLCFFIGRSLLTDYEFSVDHLLSKWGGEALCFPLEGRPSEKRLQGIGTPSVIVANVDVTTAPETRLLATFLLNVFVGRSLRLRGCSATINLRDDVAPSSIVEVWQPGHPEYNRHTELPRS